MAIRAALRLAAAAGLVCAGACLAADAPGRADGTPPTVASLLSPSPTSDGAASGLHVPLPGASTADHAMPSAPEPVRHHWSVLAAIALIVAAVAWSLLRQAAAGAGRRQ